MRTLIVLGRAALGVTIAASLWISPTDSGVIVRVRSLRISTDEPFGSFGFVSPIVLLYSDSRECSK